MPSRPNVLIVEDDLPVLYTLEAALGFGGFRSEACSTVMTALDLFEEHHYDAVLVDLGLPDLKGTYLIKELRARSDVAIVVVSGSASPESRIEALDLGADDFVAKPFSPTELLARLRAVLRRFGSLPGSSQPATAEDFRSPALAPLERKIFEMLAEEDRYVTSAELLTRLWGGKVHTGKLRVAILSLRRKLAQNRASYDIENQRGFGYRLTRL